MANADHYAILVAITRYMGISPLRGPENDAREFRDWLLATDGGDIPEANIVSIFSSDFPPATAVQEERPAERTFKLALENWLKDGSEWKEHAGKRLYLFLAGHGFTAGSTPNPALYTADAQITDTVHIAALVFAEKIANGGFFDEIALVMDCCQDVRLTAPAPLTLWDPPDRRNTDVKLMYVVAAPRGRKSFETTDPATPGRGYFTQKFMEALRSARPDEAPGWITARDVEERLQELWSRSGLRDRYGYEPVFVAPRNFLLFPWGATSGAFGSLGADPDADDGFGELAVTDSHAPTIEAPPGPQAPRVDTWAQHPGHAAACAELMQQSASRASPGRAALLVFARDSLHQSGTPWQVSRRARKNVTLRWPRSPDAPWQVHELSGDAHDVEGWCAMHAIDLDAGTCVVGLPLLQGDVEMRQEITVPLCAGRRTEIYLDASDSMLSPRQLDVTTAALRIVPANATPSLDDPGFRAAEDARLALMEGRIVVDDNLLEAASRDAVDSPLLVMHYACSLTAAPAVDVQRLLGLCEALERGPLRGMADVILLRALVDHLRDPDGPSGLQLEDPPCVAASWAIAARLQVRFSRPVQQAVCLWRRASPVWTQTQIPGEGLPQGASAAPPHLLSLLRRGMEEDPLSPQAVIRETARAWMVDQDLVSELAFESAAGIVNYSNS